MRTFLLDDAVSLLTLTGPGGVGKTRLALQVAQELAPQFAQGAVFVPLASVVEASFVPSVVAQALDVRESGNQIISERLVVALRDRPLLLVLDNFEHLLPAASFVADLLASCPALTILVTSRTTLGVSGEQRFPVPPLAVPEPVSTTAADAGHAAAVQLFVARAQAAQPSFALTEANAGTVADICRRLDGLPLAIELAAARIAVLPPSALLGRLEQRLPLLTGGPRDAPPRHRTMRNAIAWTYDFLGPDQQGLFRGLAIFMGGFSLEAAEAMARAVGAPQHDVLDRVAALVGASLVQPGEWLGDQTRYQMLEMMREFGLERLVDAGEETMIRDAHRDWILSFVEWISPLTHGPGATTWLDQAALEHANLRAALAWSLSREDADAALRMCGALLDYWFFRGHISEGHRWLAASLAIGDDSPSPLRARALHGLGSFASRLGDPVCATAALEKGLELYRALGDRHGAGEVLTVLGRMAEDNGDYPVAERFLSEAQMCFEELGDAHSISQTLYHLGIIAQGQGDLDLAMARYEAAQRPARATNDYFNIATTLWFQGHVHCVRGDLARAADALEEAMAMEQTLGHVEGAAPTFATFAVLADAVGLPEAAARILGTAVGVLTRQGLSFGLPERIDYDQALALARSQLGEEAFDAAWNIGQARSIEASAADIDAILTAARACPTMPQLTARFAERGLSPRESEVLRLVAQGRSNREIAAALFISVPTVKSHLTSILSKLSLPSRAAATAYAHTHGLL